MCCLSVFLFCFIFFHSCSTILGVFIFVYQCVPAKGLIINRHRLHNLLANAGNDFTHTKKFPSQRRKIVAMLAGKHQYAIHRSGPLGCEVRNGSMSPLNCWQVLVYILVKQLTFCCDLYLVRSLSGHKTWDEN